MAPRADGQEGPTVNGVEDKVGVWREMEHTYWLSVQALRQREDNELEQEFKARAAPIVERNLELYKERARLQELVKQVDQQTKTNDGSLHQINTDLERSRERLGQKRAIDDEARRLLFQQRRLEALSRSATPVAPETGPVHTGGARIPPMDARGQPGVPLNGYHQPPRGNGMHGSQTSDLNGAALSLLRRSPRSESRVIDPARDDWRGPTKAAPPPRELHNGAREPGERPPSPPLGTPKPAEAAHATNTSFATKGAEASTPQRPGAAANRHKGGDSTGVRVFDANGDFVGEVLSLHMDNVWVQAAKALPIKRPVHIRPNRRFTAEHLDSIYEPTDNKGAKWLSCVIQAAGDVQSTPCHPCISRSGVFPECIMVENRSLFPRCGNCEWNRQGCQGAPRPPAVEQTEPEGEKPAAGEAGEHPPLAPAPSGFTAVNSFAGAARKPDSQETFGRSRDERNSLPIRMHGSPESMEAHDSRVEASTLSKKARKSLPNTRHPSTTPSGAPEGEDTQLHHSKSKGSRKKKDANPDEVEDPQVTAAKEAEKQARWIALGLDTITKDTLLLRDNGAVYTEPEIMRGVPIEKITPAHPYWDPLWPSIDEMTRPQLEKWTEKYNKHVVDKSLPSSSKFLAGRQVNRGKQILDFLEKGELHPYQIVGKQWVTKALANYDVVFRLIGTLKDLETYNIDMKPHQWLRMRLHEIYEEKGLEFNLAKVVGELYHDPKIQGIRERSGHGSIGRPSGYNMDKTKQKKADGAKKGTPRGKKRKDLHETPDGGSGQEPEPEPHQEQEQGREREREPEHGQEQGQEQEGGLSPEDELNKSGRRGHHETPSAEATPAKEEEEKGHTGPVTRSRPSSAQGPPHPRTSDSVKTRPSSRRTQAGSASQQTSPSATQQKKQKSEPSQQSTNNPQSTTEEDLAYEGYTSTDSYSDDRVLTVDWRVYQVRTQVATTNTRVTQYWHWVADKGYLEHQVLSSVKRNTKTKTSTASWGVYKDPYDFHLRLAEVEHITWAPGTLKVLMTTKEIDTVDYRGDVYVSFKRDRTKRRFLAFMKKKKVKLLKSNKEYVEEQWRSVASGELPMDSESDDE